MLTRRHFIQTTTALFSVTGPGMAFADTWPTEAQKAEWDAQVTPQGYVAETSNPWGLHPRFLPQRVVAKAGLVPGDIHVDAVARYLYHIEEYTIKRKVRWPHWQPTQSMINRDPELYADIADGMEPGPENALGSRALYLYVGDRDTLLRIHGTPSPRSIGGRASSGCVRMVMAHINDLYPNVETGSTAYLYSAEDSVTARS